jgi:hypothetical protein
VVGRWPGFGSASVSACCAHSGGCCCGWFWLGGFIRFAGFARLAFGLPLCGFARVAGGGVSDRVFRLKIAVFGCRFLGAFGKFRRLKMGGKSRKFIFISCCYLYLFNIKYKYIYKVWCFFFGRLGHFKVGEIESIFSGFFGWQS